MINYGWLLFSFSDLFSYKAILKRADEVCMYFDRLYMNVHIRKLYNKLRSLLRKKLPDERKQRILFMLEQQGKVLATELSQYFQVPDDTICRDQRELDAARCFMVACYHAHWLLTRSSWLKGAKPSGSLRCRHYLSIL